MGTADFAQRCSAPGVLRCVGFDVASDLVGTYGDNHGTLPGADNVPTRDTVTRASGAGSLRFRVASSTANSAGSYFINFSDDLRTQFGANETFYVQWRQRFSSAFLSHRAPGAGGFKLSIIGAGDKPGCTASTSANGTCMSSCSPLEVVTQNTYLRGFAQMYNSCTGSTSHGPYNAFEEPFGGSDFKLQNARPSPFCLYSQSNAGTAFPPQGNCIGFFPDEWMTFQVQITTGPRVGDEWVGSRVKLWIAREGQPSRPVFDWGPYNLTAGPQSAGLAFGKVWLLPYNTNSSPSVTLPAGDTWYDELIVSRNLIADPLIGGGPVGGGSSGGGAAGGGTAGGGAAGGGTAGGGTGGGGTGGGGTAGGGATGGGAAWSPSYAVPAPGQLACVSTPWLQNAINAEPGMPASFFWEYSLFNSYGAGVLVEDYSPGGGYVFAGTGGHAHPDFTGAVVVDFTTLTARIIQHTNGSKRWSTNTNTYGFLQSELSGDPWWEVTGTVAGSEAVPAPVHPYQMLVPVPSSLGGGPRGSVMYVGRQTMGETGQTSSPTIHRFDLSTGRWHRQTTAQLQRVSYESSVVLDRARGRYWHFPNGQHNHQNFEYLRASDWSVQNTTPSWPGFANAQIGGDGRAFLSRGFLFMQGLNGTLWFFDPDAPAAGVRQIALTATLGNRRDLLVHYPPTGKFYTVTQNGGSLTRVTPPGNPAQFLSSPWTVDTVSLNAPLPPVTSAGDPGGAASQYALLFYVPSIQRLAWLPNGSTICLLAPP